VIDIKIFKGIPNNLRKSDINIIIDVLRAFTVSYYSFKKNIKKIILVNTIEEALKYKKNAYTILSGEIDGYKIRDFDIGNSPYEIYNINLKNKILVQKTTNGVKAVFNALNADQVFVTGFVNVCSLIEYIKNITDKDLIINIIVSDKEAEEDIACAEYIKKMLLNDIDKKKLDEETVFKIINSKNAKKFLNSMDMDFSINDLIMALSLEKNNFIMEVVKEENNIIIKRRING
jgi:2-phosphosulfolactate phosphatase